MSIEVLTVILVLAILIILLIGAPVGFAMGGTAMLIGYFVMGPRCFNIIHPTTMNTISGFTLIAIPLFIFMGQIILQSGIGEKMFSAFHVLAGGIRGGLAIGVIVVCSVIAAMVGVIAAGIMTAGTVALQPMLKRGYNKNLALGSIMAGGGMGILIPPSIPMILFASVTNTSIGKMFAGGLLPGILMSGLFVVYILIRCYLNPELGPPFKPEKKIETRDKLIALRDTFVAFGLIVAVLGTIISGMATTTEAAAVGALGAVIVASFYGRFNLNVLRDSTMEGMKLSSICIWLFIGALVFNNFHMLMGAGKLIRDTITTIGFSPIMVIILMQITIFLMGFIMDDYVILLLCSPIYTPIAISMGFDPIWFGILMILQLEIAIQTPPYGFALFYMKAIVPKELTMVDVYKSITPFLLIKIFVLILVMIFPGIATWLPGIFFD